MTKKKDLKKRVRERQAKTGERYTAALAQVREPKIPEAPDASAEAQAEGFRCTAIVSAKLRAVRDLRPIFARLRELLLALDAEACGPLLHGAPVPKRMPVMSDFVQARRFLANVRAGERGLSDDGRAFAISWEGRTVVGAIVLVRKPMLQLGLLEDAPWPEALLLLGIGG